MLAQKIYQYLEQNGIKQTWLAAQLGMAKSTMNGIFKGRTRLKAETFLQICDILRVSPEIFSERKDTE